jgi:hypothetical protein
MTIPSDRDPPRQTPAASLIAIAWNDPPFITHPNPLPTAPDRHGSCDRFRRQ